MSKFDSDIDKAFDQLGKDLDGIKKDVDSLTEDTEANKIITPEFMKSNTPFASLEGMLQAGGFELDFDVIDADQLNKFISQNTRFASWEELLGEAYDIYLENNLNL